MVRQRLMRMVWQVLAVMPLPAGSRSALAVVVAGEQAGEHVDGFEEQRVDSGLPVSGAPGAVAGGEMVPAGGGLLFVLGGLVSGLVACPPPAQRLGAGDGLAGGLAVSPW
jgi:hypothetical protein